MAVFSIDSLRDRFDLLGFFGQGRNVKHRVEAVVVLDIAEFDRKLALEGKDLVSKSEVIASDPRMGLGVWGEVKHLDWERVLSSDTYYRDHVKNQYDEVERQPEPK